MSRVLSQTNRSICEEMVKDIEQQDLEEELEDLIAKQN